MKVEKCLQENVVVLSPEEGIKEAAAIFSANKIWAAPVLDKDRRVVGILSITDILNTFSPDFLSLLKNVDFIKDYGALDLTIKDVEELAKLKVSDVMTSSNLVGCWTGISAGFSPLRMRPT